MKDKEALAKKVFLEFYSSFILDDEIEETGRVFYLAQKASMIHLNLIRGVLQNDEYIINMAYLKDVINKIKI
jgi:glycerol-3-phosphate responsive antiterminator